MRIHHSIFVAASLVATLSAQGVNCNLLGTFNSHGPFNDVWGYTAPNGDEYALLGATTGTVVIDISNPATPVERGWFPWGNSIWRDIRTYGHYAYVVTEATAGFQILDLSNPNSPTVVGVFGTANSNNAHNVCIDTGAGRLYLAGSNTGTPAYDLTVNAANPTFLGFATGPGNSNYFHDICAENGFVYGSMIYNGVLRIINAASSLPWGSLSNSPTPNNFTHNAWPNAAGTVCVTCDEQTGGVVKFFDITNKSNPIPRGQFTPNTASIPHNAFIVGNTCHVSWYTEGYRCIDISNPSNPVEIASYDTWPGASGGYNGCWGCYPFLPSGNILASDRVSGLFIVKPRRASFQKYGQSCPGSGPLPVSCDVNPGGAPVINTIYQVTLSNAAASATAFLLTGLSDAIYQNTPLPAPIPGAPGCLIYAAPDVTLLVFATGAGTASVSFSVPNSVSYIGLELFHQWAVLDAVNALGIVVSDAGKATVGV